MQEDLNQLVAEANSGSKAALETIVGYAQGYVYNLALRMLQLPMDADDATQEIMIKLISNLNQFRGESQFSTWIYLVASNHLLNMRMREKEKTHLSTIYPPGWKPALRGMKRPPNRLLSKQN